MARVINRRSSKTDNKSVSLTEAAQLVVLFRTVVKKSFSQSELSTPQAFLQGKELADHPWHSEEELAAEAGILQPKGLPSSSTVRDRTGSKDLFYSRVPGRLAEGRFRMRDA